jgi:hypothetical protein
MQSLAVRGTPITRSHSTSCLALAKSHSGRAHRGSVAPPWPAVRPDAKRAPRPAATQASTSASVAALVCALWQSTCGGRGPVAGRAAGQSSRVQGARGAHATPLAQELQPGCCTAGVAARGGTPTQHSTLPNASGLAWQGLPPNAAARPEVARCLQGMRGADEATQCRGRNGARPAAGAGATRRPPGAERRRAAGARRWVAPPARRSGSCGRPAAAASPSSGGPAQSPPRPACAPASLARGRQA